MPGNAHMCNHRRSSSWKTDHPLMDDEVLVSYDVKSLFTNIPVEEAIIICERRLHADATLPKRTTMSVPIIISLLRFCLTSTSFRYNNQHYQQLDGVAMGSPVSPVVSDIFMEDFEDKALSDGSICPRLWKRFVDDVLAVVKRDKGSPLLDHLNEQHPNIKFTMEEEEEGSLPFMDVRFTRTANGKLHRQVYQKPTHTNRYVQYDSHQPDSVKSGMIAGLVNRAMIVSSDETTLEKEVKHIKTVMASNGYPKQFVDKAIRKQMRKKNNIDTGKNTDKERKSMQTASIPFVDGLSQEVRRLARSADIRCTFFSPNSTQQLYAVKDRLPTDHSTHVVYSIKCNTCEEEYVGETMRALHVRCKEHRDAIRLVHPEKSAVAEHVLDSNNEEPHEIKWSEVTILDHAKHTRERKIREAFQIEKKHPGMNRDRGIAKSSTWNAIVWTATDTCERWSLGYLCTCISTTMTLLITCNFYFFLCNIFHFFCTLSLLCEVFTRASFLENTLNVPVSANLPFVILMKAAQSDRNVDRKTTEWRLVLGLIKMTIHIMQWGLFIKMATDWEVSEVGDTCRPAAGPGRGRSVCKSSEFLQELRISGFPRFGVSPTCFRAK